MKSLLVGAATAALLLAAPAALAEDHHDHGGGAPHADHAVAADHGHAAMTMQGPSHEHRANPGMATTTAAPSAGRQSYETTNKAGKTVIHVNGFGNAQNSGKHDDNMHGGNMRGGNNHGHVTINFRRHDVTASHHFHYRGGVYRWPHGYHYQRWTFGMTLPSLFWSRDYWIDDYSDYGLAYPPPGAVWVRYGDDAILIDEDSGEILEVVYGQFY